MFGPWPHWDFLGVMSAIATWITGFVLFLVWLAVLLLFVRFLLIATRAAKVYLRAHGEHDGVLPPRAPAPAPAAPAASTAPAASATSTATAPTKPAPRTRTPKPPMTS
jgi:hypothetical protein